VVYNRVPKCGSTTTLDIIRFLRKKLHYNVFNDIAPKMKHFMESDEQEYGKKGNSESELDEISGLVRNITQFKRPILYIRHVYFVDFPKYGYREPLYINIARDPVSLFISNYFYLRFGFQVSQLDSQICSNPTFRRRRTQRTRRTGNTTCLTSRERGQLTTVSKRKLRSARDRIQILFPSFVALQGKSCKFIKMSVSIVDFCLGVIYLKYF
jgi:hypothetical protein